MIKKLVALLVCVLVLNVFGSGESLATGESLIYKLYKDNTGQITCKSYVEINGLPGQEKKITQKTETDDYIIIDEFVLDKDYMTSNWKRTRADEGTDYFGEKKGKTLYIKGKLRGEGINLKIALDDKPFYDIPKFNLTGFALSDKKNIYFWTLRKDNLSKTLMQAKKRGETTLLINGKEMDVIKIYYTATGVSEKYYKQVYYFRKADGLFVKKITSNESITDLISEK